MPSIGMLQVHDLVVRPVKMVGDKGYLLVELIEGVAYHSPGVVAVSAGMGTSMPGVSSFSWLISL